MRRAASRLKDVYWTWRFPLLLLGAVGLSVLVAVTPASSRWWLALALTTLFGSILALHGLDVARQDRLRDDSNEVSAAHLISVPRTRREAPSSWRPVVSIVVTTHNEDELLLDCLHSISQQTWSDWECIVVDDLSTDNTLNRAAAAAEDDDRFRFVHNETNLGLAGSRNRGLALSRGEWVTFVDADDFLYPDAIENRLRRVAEEKDDGFVVGAYCSWHSVAEDAKYETTEPPKAAPREDVTWLSATYGAPFIASAPLVKREAALAIGGFEPSLETAEDFEFWSRLLRHGYTVLWTPTVGVGYRQRKSSMYRRTSIAHASITSSVYDYNEVALGEDVEAKGPYLFREPASVYRGRIARTERLITGFIAAIASRDVLAEQQLWSDLQEWAEPWMKWNIRPGLISNAVQRVESYAPNGFSARVALISQTVSERVSRLWETSTPTRQRGDRAPREIQPPGPFMELESPRIMTGISGSDNAVLLLPAAAYHCDELGPLANELTSRGVNVEFYVLPRYLASVEGELRKYNYPVHVEDPASGNVERLVLAAGALVTLNDWGEYKDLVDLANLHDIPTFGKVEGVQDFFDDDVHWTRNAYQSVSHVLCQGRNDLLNTKDRSSIVGSTRLERIWAAKPTATLGRVVVVNLNFTYGVLAEASDMWLDSVVQACKLAKLPIVISAHPAQKIPPTIKASRKPMRYLLTQPSILVSRFSTVPFEAMARGVPFVYHNPHGEKVPTFHEPGGAFPITTSATELAAALVELLDVDDYRSVCREFFLSQVDVDRANPSEVRTAEVILS